MNTAAFIVSLVAVAISCLALGWNIYRDVIIKPRVRVDMAFATASRDPVGGVSVLSNPGKIPANDPFVLLTAVNHGPGKARLSVIITHCRRGWFRMQRGVVKPSPAHELSDSLPKALEEGDSINVVIPLRADGFLAERIVRLGIRDQYSRTHWVRRRTVRKMKTTFDRAIQS